MMRPRTMRAWAVAVLLLTAACSTAPDSTPQTIPGQGSAPTTPPGQAASAPGEPGPAEGPATPNPGGGGPQDQPAGGGGGDGAPAQPGGPAPPQPGPSDLAGVGAMCRDYLRGSIPRLVVEIDHQAGVRPSEAAIQHLLAVLGGVVEKPGGVVLAGGNEIPGGAEVWTVDALRALAQEHRSQYSSATQATVYVLALRGRFEQEDSIGVAYRASEFALFPERIDSLAVLLGGATALTRAVLVHEMGHLLCLINLGYSSAIDHEDPEHPHHSSDRASVMFWAIENSAVAQLFTGPPPDDFTANDRADLEGLRTGRY